MAFRTVFALSALCVCIASATEFGYAPDEPVGDSQDRIQHAFGKIQKLANNFRRMSANAKNDGTQLLQALAIQSNDPEGLQALIYETQLAISQSAPTGVDISSCESGNDAKYQKTLEEAGPGIQACLQSTSASLQPYFQHLSDMVAFSDGAAEGANGNVTYCANSYQGDLDGLTKCLEAVKVQVFNGRDQLMAAILGTMADFRSQRDGPLIADFTTCTNAVQDKAINESVNVIVTTRACIKGLNSSSGSGTSA